MYLLICFNQINLIFKVRIAFPNSFWEKLLNIIKLDASSRQAGQDTGNKYYIYYQASHFSTRKE